MIRFIPPNRFLVCHAVVPYNFFAEKISSIREMHTRTTAEIDLLTEIKRTTFKCAWQFFEDEPRVKAACSMSDGTIKILLQSVLMYKDVGEIDRLIETQTEYKNYLTLCENQWLGIKKEADELIHTYLQDKPYREILEVLSENGQADRRSGKES